MGPFIQRNNGIGDQRVSACSRKLDLAGILEANPQLDCQFLSMRPFSDEGVTEGFNQNSTVIPVVELKSASFGEAR